MLYLIMLTRKSKFSLKMLLPFHVPNRAFKQNSKITINRSPLIATDSTDDKTDDCDYHLLRGERGTKNLSRRWEAKHQAMTLSTIYY